MTYEERSKTLCNNCEAKENCSYISRNLESKCSFKETTMYGWELGYRDAVDKACEWLKDYVADYLDRDKQYQLPIIDVVELITDFRKEMEE